MNSRTQIAISSLLAAIFLIVADVHEVSAQSLTVLHSFSGADGSDPNSALILGSDGEFYGTTYGGGSAGNSTGTVFKIAPSGTLTTLFSFSAAIGGGPMGIVQGNDGDFYGTTYAGGEANADTIFKMTPSGALTTLVFFNTSTTTAAYNPNALIKGSDGNFYGSTAGAEGYASTIFMVAPSGALSNLYTWSSGGGPCGALVQASDGNFYGNAGGGGNAGSVFKVTPSGALTYLVLFTGPFGGTTTGDDPVPLNGEDPIGSPVQGTDGNFYGTTAGSPGFRDYGSVFRLTPSGTLTELVFFNYENGAYPTAPLTQGSDGNFYGTTSGGGPNTNGTIFKMSPSGTLLSVLHTNGYSISFLDASPATANAALIEAGDGSFLGTSFYGGSNGLGTVFRVAFPEPIVVQPMNQKSDAGTTATFSVANAPTSSFFSAASAQNSNYQWQVSSDSGSTWTNVAEAVPYSGTTTSTLTVSGITGGLSGNQYQCVISDSAEIETSGVGILTVASPAPTPTPTPTPPSGASSTRLTNISTRAQVGTGGNILIPGFIISGSGTETLLIRGDGPSLSQFGVAGVLAQPSLSVVNSAGTVIASNTGWGKNANPAQIASVAAQVNAFPFASGSADSAVIVNLPAGAYTVEIAGVNNTTGVALAEIYEVSSTGTRLSNISARAQVGTGGNILIPGFVISGTGTEQLLVRGDGPALTQYGVTGVLAKPSLSVIDDAGNVVAANTGYETSSNLAQILSDEDLVGAFAPPTGSADSAAVVNLSPGAYTMEITGVNNTTGVALAEVYEVPGSGSAPLAAPLNASLLTSPQSPGSTPTPTPTTAPAPASGTN